VGEYYQKARHIPAAISSICIFPPGRHALEKDEFNKLKTEIDRATPKRIQATRLPGRTLTVWVACPSLPRWPSALNEKYCSSKCGRTKPSSYFQLAQSFIRRRILKMRPAMMLAGKNFEQVKD